MSSLFLWEVGSPKVYLIWVTVLVAQILVAEVNRRWNWTIFVVWTVGGIALMPYAWIHGTPMVGWFPFGKYVIMILTATMTGTVLLYAKRNPVKAHRYAIWLGVALWVGLAANIMEANLRDLTIYLSADRYYACAADWQCLRDVDESHTIGMISGLPEARGVAAELRSTQWYQQVAENLAAHRVGIDPETGFRTIGGWWNLASAAAGMLNIVTITGLGKIVATSPGKRKVRGLIWVDMVWPWVIAYDLWNHAFLYNSLADYTWYCTLALLLACTIPAFTWAKGRWIWFRCFTLVFWISMNTLLPELLVPPSDIFNFATMDPRANIACAVVALAANLALFVYWSYKIVRHRRNPLTGVLYCELGEFRRIVHEHCDDKDMYFLVDRIPETPEQLGFDPENPSPPVDGYVSRMPWWGKADRRWPKPRTPVSADPGLVERGVVAEPRWEVDALDRDGR